MSNSSAKVFESIEISNNDKRSYRHLVLENEIEVVLVHDKDTEKSAACCDVKAGSMCDPKDVQGLAHFLEHMLFLGTEKYPVENAYSSFLNSHGGSSNAYTSQEDTVYYFDIQNEFLEDALDMFSSFFVCPMFTQDATSRELNAVDNENTKNLQSDMWRGYQLMKSLANQSHPFSYFSTGNAETLKTNLETLNIDLREQLLSFYEKYYSANLMKVVVYGKDSLDDMQRMVVERFSAVKNKSLPKPTFAGDTYDRHNLGLFLQVVPVRDVKQLEMYFPMPPTDPMYRTKPNRYLSHLLGHESAGSILACLKEKGWANGLSACGYQATPDCSFLNLVIDLTNEGINHTNDCVSCVFEYIEMLRTDGKAAWIAEEVKDSCDLDFRFLNKSEPSDEVTRLANAMQDYPKEHIISGQHIVFDLDSTDAIALLDCLRVENSVVIVKHKGLAGQTKLVEKWYGTQYSKDQFTVDQMALWSSGEKKEKFDVHLPVPNPFLPTEFSLKCEEEGLKKVEDKYPSCLLSLDSEMTIKESDLYEVCDGGVEVLLADSDKPPSEPAVEATEEPTEEDEEEEGDEEEERAGPVNIEVAGRSLQCWHLLDDTWKVPKVNVFIKLETILASSSPGNVALTEMYCRVMKEILNEHTYYADCAGIHFQLSVIKSGLQLCFYGYHHKLPVLVAKAFDDMTKLGSAATGGSMCNADLFARLKEKILRDYANFKYNQPYYHCILGTVTCLEDPRWTSSEKYIALADMTLEDFLAFAGQLTRQLRVEVLVHGNASVEEANRIAMSVPESLGCKSLPLSMEANMRIVSLPMQSEHIYRQHSLSCNPEEKNSAVENMYLITNDEQDITIADASMLELIAHLASEPAFDQLRTKEQLGYIVHIAAAKSGDFPGLQVIVQSNHKDATYLDCRIELFLKTYREEILAEMTSETLQTNIAAVIEKQLEKPKNLNEESSQLWHEIANSHYVFNRKVLQSDYLRSVTMEQVVSFYDKYFSSSGAGRKKFSSQFFGQGTKYPAPQSGAATSVVIKNHSAFKRSKVMLPMTCRK